jgi:hypothetical protein
MEYVVDGHSYTLSELRSLEQLDKGRRIAILQQFNRIEAVSACRDPDRVEVVTRSAEMIIARIEFTRKGSLNGSYRPVGDRRKAGWMPPVPLVLL